MTVPRPYALLAEVTYRCPLHCPYCSNPVTLVSPSSSEALAKEDVLTRIKRDAGNPACESRGRQDCLPHSGSIGKCTVLLLYFVVPEDDRDRVFALTINVRRLPYYRWAFSCGRSRLTQDRFYLLLRHAFRNLIHVRLGDSLADATVEHEHEHEHDNESRRSSEHRDHRSHSGHLSHSPITKSRLPRTAGTSLTRQPGKSSGRMLRFTKDGARIFNRYGTPPPLLLM